MKRILLLLYRFFILILCSIVLLYTLCFFIPAPSLGQGHYIKLYDNQQKIFYQSNQQSNDVSLKDISPYFLKSIVAIEDHRFYTHRGFDPIGILRATKNNMQKGKSIQGASTITQQYARLMFLTNEKTYTRKIKEAFLTIRLETHYDKNKILQGYVNTVYFGHGIYGIKNAAHYFFNKEPISLDINEATLLAGVINGPEYYSPFINLNQAKIRQKKVLDALVDYHEISQEQAKKVEETPFHLNQNPTSLSKQYPYYKDAVINELKELGFYKENYINQGLNIQTTLDSSIQEELEQITQKELQNKNELQTASLIIDNQQAGVVALVGGKNYNESQFNRALFASRQIGSTIKPLLYYIALNNGFTPTTKFKSEPTTFKLDNGQTYSPSNFSKRYANKEITMAQAIAVSDNIYAVKTHLFLGEQALVNFLYQFNYKHVSPHPSLALGTLNTNIYHLSYIYMTFANEGLYNKPHFIEKITNHQNQILYQYKKENKQLLNKETCLILSQLLKSPFYKELGTYSNATMALFPTNTSYAVKTGSSSFDSVCIGYNPQYTLSSWCGYDDNRKLDSYSDSKTPKVIFQHMANTLSKEEKWYEPGNLQVLPINPLTGEYQKNGRVYWFKK